MNIADIVALAKMGYKPSDVKDLIDLASSKEEPPAQEETKEQPEKTEQHEDGKERPDEVPKKDADTSKESEAINEYKQKIEELEKKVKDLQSENVHKNNSNADMKSDEDVLNDITRSFM